MIKQLVCRGCGAEFEGVHHTMYCAECATKRNAESRRKYLRRKRGCVVRPVKEPVGNIMECTQKAQELGMSYGQYMLMMTKENVKRRKI